MTPTQYLSLFKEAYHAAENPTYAEKQAQYMRNKFAFYGLRNPEQKAIAKDIIKANPLPQGEDLQALILEAMNEDYRELHYTALFIAEKVIKKQAAAFIEVLEELILTNSWWDTVDWINKLVGIHFKRYPDLIVPTTEKWMASGNIWLQRICIIFQLTYKEQVNFDLMSKYILELKGSQEFFIQKAAGWALRQYSKFCPQVVIDFIAKHPELANLTQREGLKYINRK